MRSEAPHESAADQRRVLILDDDPTGTQTASDVDVMLKIGEAEFDAFFASAQRCIYILTNSRSLNSEDAVSLLEQIRRQARAAATRSGESVAFILRGDSTLRGHVFDEVAVFSTDDSVTLLVPAYPDAGRVTLDGVHYMTVHGRRIPVARTEFARDPVFGYRSIRMVDWVAEVGGGTNASCVPLADLRHGGAAGLASLLLAAPAGAVLIPDVETDSDLAVIVDGLLRAEARGRDVVVRSAAPLASMRTGLAPRRIDPYEVEAGSSILVVCGSHTRSSTRQLSLVGEATGAEPIVVPSRLIDDPNPQPALEHIATQVLASLEQNPVTILATQRLRRREHQTLPAAARMMHGLVSIAARVKTEASAVVCKGGITSAAIAKEGFGATTARVLGQVADGVAIWELPLQERTIPYIVVPGNIGDDDTLADLITGLMPSGAALPTEDADLHLR
jgi:uncharacterized protein YgbK (DUF1537 family)